MEGLTHVIGGLCAAEGAIILGLLPAGMETYAVVTVGALFPDLDAGQSLATRPSQLLPFRLGELVIFRPLDEAAGLLGRLTQRMLGHRGFLHYPLFYPALMGLWWFLTREWVLLPAFLARVIPSWETYLRIQPYWRPLAVGIYSHIVLDWLTTRSIAPLAPLTMWQLNPIPKWARVSTGGKVEGLIALVLSAGLGWWKFGGVRL